MKFSKKTLQILKNFSNINPSIFLQKGNMINTCHIDKYSYAEAQIEDAIPDDIGIYDLNNFLALIDLMNDPEIEYIPERSELVISNGKSTLYYTTASPSTIIYPKNSVNFPTPDVVFDVKAEQLSEMNRVIRAMNIDCISFESDNGDIYLRGYNTSNDQKMERVLYSIRLKENGTTVEFKSILRVANMKIMDLDYTAMIMFKAGGGAVKFEADEPALSYFIVLEKTSTFDK